jgi:predicted metal-binding protein
MEVDTDQLLIASQATILERLATRAVECISDGSTIVCVIVLQHGGCPTHVHHDRPGKE